VGCGFKSLSAELPFAGDKLRAEVDLLPSIEVLVGRIAISPQNLVEWEALSAMNERSSKQNKDTN
jgi:hypothetical protein